MGWGVVQGGKKPLVRTLLEYPLAYMMAHVTLIGHRDVQSTVGTQHLIGILYWCLVLVMTLESRQNVLQKKSPVNI